MDSDESIVNKNNNGAACESPPDDDASLETILNYVVTGSKNQMKRTVEKKQFLKQVVQVETNQLMSMKSRLLFK